MTRFTFGGREYDTPPNTYRVMHEVEKAWGTPWSKLTEAQRSIGVLWYAARVDNPGLTPEAMLDTDMDELDAVPLVETPEIDGPPPSDTTSE